MQASRPSTPINHASSPPSDYSRDLLQHHSTGPQSPSSPDQGEWASPTHTLGHSSPELPPLPSLPALGGPGGSSESKNTNEEYYTASWGSPYRVPPPVSGVAPGASTPERDLTGSDAASDDNSSELHFGLDHLLPSRVPDEESPDFGLDFLLPSRLPLNQATPTASHFAQLVDPSNATPRPLTKELFQSILEQGPGRLSEDWFRKFFAGQTQEQADWSEEESLQSETEILQVTKSSQQQDDTPSKSGKERKVSKGHRSRKNNLTLKQDDFWTHFSQGQQETIAKMMASRFAPKPEEREAKTAPPADISTSPIHSKEDSRLPDTPEASTILSSPDRPDRVPAPLSTKPQPSPTESKPRSPIVLDKPLPTPPPEAAATHPSSPIDAKREQDAVSAPQPAPSPAPKRARKAVKSSKRTYWIDLPNPLARGGPNEPPKIMAPEEVKAKMKRYERQGYDTRGFGHWRGKKNLLEPTGHAQNRDEFPDPTEQYEPMVQKKFQVKIPNAAEWRAYQDFLVEQKLAALGVSLGGSDEPSSATMSRQASGPYPALPFSPPIPSQSSNSQRHGHSASIFSGSFSTRGPSPGHQSTRSIASPLSSIGNPRGSMSHMHRHSTFTSPGMYAAQPTPPGMNAFSPQGYFTSQGVARGGSPALGSTRMESNDQPVSASPLGFNPQNFSFPQADDMLAQFQQLQQQRQSPLQNQSIFNMRPASTLAEVPEDEGEGEDEVPSRPQLVKRAATDIAEPVPRGHRHNISDNLTRDVESADYHLEEAIDKQLNEGGEFSPGGRFGLEKAQPAKRNADDDVLEWRRPRPVEQVLHQPQPHNRTHSLTQPQRITSLGYNQSTQPTAGELSDGQKTNISEITNPSAEERAAKARGSGVHSTQGSMGSSAWQPGHGSRASKNSLGSSLNAGAKEFKFNPTATFKPGGNFAFGGSSGFDFQPSSNPTSNATSNPNPFSQTLPMGAKPPTFGASTSGWNVAAPAFTPGASLGSNFSSDFNFASSGPTFKPDAPTFQTNFVAPAPTSHRSKESIFGPVNFSHKDIIKPARRSKAIPILKPDATQGHTSDEEQGELYGEDGHVLQSADRFKRSRFRTKDGDDVPLFASPAEPQVIFDPFKASPQAPSHDASAVEGEIAGTAATALSQGDDVPAGDFAGARDDESTATTIAEKEYVPEVDDVGTTHDQHNRNTSKHGSKTSLSAVAKEFTPRFGSGQNFEFGLHVTKPSGFTDIDDAPAFPTRHFSQSPGTTFRPSDDGSYKTAFSRRRHVVDNESVDYDDSFAHPSFNEIDEVMKAMNEEGSDFGVERGQPSWDQSSQQHDALDFNDTVTLRPTQHLRSDAPSPSPRRLVPASDLRRGESTELTQDPFSDSKAGLAYESPVHRLNNAQDAAISDWDDMISEGQEAQLRHRAQFFDNRVDDVIDSALASRLGPVEEHLRMIQEQLATNSRRGARSARRSYSTERRDSDADDEDDDNDEPFRNRSPEKSRKLEKYRAIVLDALASHEPRTAPAAPVDLSEVHQVLAELKVSMAEQQARTPPTPPKIDLSEIEQALIGVRTAVDEQRALSARPPTPPTAPNVDLSSVHEAIQGLQASVAEQIAKVPALPALDLAPIQQTVEELRATIVEQQKEAPPAPVETPAPDLSEFYQALSDFKLSLVEQQSARDSAPKAVTPPPVDPEFMKTVNDIKSSLQEHLQAKLLAPMPTTSEEASTSELAQIYQALAAMKVQLAQSASTHVQLEDFKDIMEEALTRQTRVAEEKHDTFKQVLDETLSSHNEQVSANREQFKDVLEEAIARHTSVGMQTKDDLRELIDDAFGRQDLKALQSHETASILEHTGRIADLEAMFNEASATVGKEREARSELEAQNANTQRSLKLADEELGLLRDEVRDEKHKMQRLEQELTDTRQTAISHKHAEDELRKKYSMVEDQVEQLEATLNEYREAANNWRDDKAQSKLEQQELQKKYDAVNLQVEEAVRVRETMRSKLEKLQDDMAAAAGSIITEKATWQKREEEHRTRYEVLSARADYEARTRERLEREVERLEIQEREGMQVKIRLEHAEAQTAKLQERLNGVSEQRDEYERNAASLERELREARDNAQAEANHTRRILETEIEAANNTANNHKMNAELTKTSYETQLQQAQESKKELLADAQMRRDASEHEMRERHERVCSAMRDQHARAIENFREDSERRESDLTARLSLADSKAEHLTDRVAHLEEQLKIARQAAQAAAQAAQAAGTKLPAVVQPSGVRAGPPEKVSPQALRESIMVLQEQLQEREGRIESLEREVEAFDTEAPAKLKERDTEIGWLRELLGVRLDDLSELITELNKPHYNRETVRDAAIRIRTTLQMEQHEKERLISGSPANSFPTLATISNMATPKAAQLAAAFGNWRRGSRTGSMASVSRPSVSRPTSRAQPAQSRDLSGTPSRRQHQPITAAPSSAQSMFSNLMTPPPSNMRRTSPTPQPQPQNPRQRSQQHSEPMSAFASTGHRYSSAPQDNLTAKSLGKMAARDLEPSTPTLLRQSSYDMDANVAEDEDFSTNGYYDDDDSTVDGGQPLSALSSELEAGGDGDERGWDFDPNPASQR